MLASYVEWCPALKEARGSAKLHGRVAKEEIVQSSYECQVPRNSLVWWLVASSLFFVGACGPSFHIAFCFCHCFGLAVISDDRARRRLANVNIYIKPLIGRTIAL